MSSRLRVIAGPNGSGKSSIFRVIKEYKQSGKVISTGPFVNSDLIEKDFQETGCIELFKYGISIPKPTIIDDYIAISTLKPPYDPNLIRDIITYEDGYIRLNKTKSSPYLGMVISDLIREELLRNKVSFTMETVFSHKDKVKFIQRAKDMDYKVYLYFVSTSDPEINVKRVEGRVAEGGHNVPTDRIINRYYRTMENLLPALKICYRAYIFDNSGTETVEIAQKDKDGTLTFKSNVPEWVLQFTKEEP